MTDTLDATAAGTTTGPTAAAFPPADLPPAEYSGFAIVFADRGFVWVGQVSTTPDWVSITGARAVRRWGTKEGLNELANKGPLENTRLDAKADKPMLVSRKAVIGLIPTEVSKWPS